MSIELDGQVVLVPLVQLTHSSLRIRMGSMQRVLSKSWREQIKKLFQSSGKWLAEGVMEEVVAMEDEVALEDVMILVQEVVLSVVGLTGLTTETEIVVEAEVLQLGATDDRNSGDMRL